MSITYNQQVHQDIRTLKPEHHHVIPNVIAKDIYCISVLITFKFKDTVFKLFGGFFPHTDPAGICSPCALIPQQHTNFTDEVVLNICHQVNNMQQLEQYHHCINLQYRWPKSTLNVNAMFVSRSMHLNTCSVKKKKNQEIVILSFTFTQLFPWLCSCHCNCIASIYQSCYFLVSPGEGCQIYCSEKPKDAGKTDGADHTHGKLSRW